MGKSKIDKFFKKIERQGLALTYDDVRLKTAHSTILPEQANVTSSFSRNVPLKIPIVSAAMDTVTESDMAIEMAQQGGIGVIHKNLSIEQQVNEVSSVKHFLHGKIPKPITVHPDETFAEVLQRKAEKGYKFNSFPVVDKRGVLKGLIAGIDFTLCLDLDTRIRRKMIEEIVYSTEDTTLEEAFEGMSEFRVNVLPLMDAKGKLQGMYCLKDVARIIKGEEEKYNVDENNNLRVAAAIGPRDYERAEALIEHSVDVLVLDSAHGDSKNIIKTLEYLKNKFPETDIVAGNISEPEAVARLIKAGADGIKVGQGPGSICTTRVIAGIGCPQVSAVYNCAYAARGTGVPIIADGGLTQTGDIPIALAVGASAVMMGSMLAGTTESPGETVLFEGRQWKEYRGMGSIGAMEVSKASRERYGQQDTGKNTLVPEGIEGRVPFKGDVANVLLQYVTGLTRGMGYTGAKNIAQLREAGIHMISAAGKAESHPHDIQITKEAPNYQKR